MYKFNLTKNKKAQLEIFGIAVVVILITVGLMFALKYSMRPKEDLKKSFTQKETAQTFVDVLLKTTAPECNNQDFTKVLEDCGSYKKMRCVGYFSSCDYLKDKIEVLLNKSFKVWRQAYKLTIKKDEVLLPDLEFSYGRCLESRPGWGYIPLYPGTIEVRFDVCG